MASVNDLLFALTLVTALGCGLMVGVFFAFLAFVMKALKGNMRGLWFIAGNIVKDVAALNKMEMLQWNAWTGMPRPNNKMQDKKRLKFFDQLATLTHEPDASFKELRKFYEDKANHLHVPDRVFNTMRRHLERNFLLWK